MTRRPGLRETLGRGWRRLTSWARSPRAGLIYDARYRMELPGRAFDAERGERILSFLESESLLTPRVLHSPRAISMARLLQVHDDAYLESLQHAGSLTGVLGFDLPDEQQDRFLSSQRFVTGGTVLASRLSLRGAGTTVNLGGGLHHAMADRGQGFCAFNDVAAAIVVARRLDFEAPILVIDLDLHDGDGTRAIFATDPSVHTLSIHNAHLGSTEAVASTSIALGDDLPDDAYLDCVRKEVPPLLEQQAPGLVFYLAGVDPAQDDSLGNWRISGDGLLERDRFVIDRVRERGIPLVILLAGGYGKSAWRHSARMLAWLLSGETLEPPETSALRMSRFRRLARRFTLGELTSEPSDGFWTLIPTDLSPGATRSRFLGYYSRHGIELALERYGLLERLRRKGFANVRVEFDLDNPSGEMVRLRSVEEEASLVELRLRRDPRVLPGFEMLSVEWLLIQNPRAEFTAERPRLPGQRFPGLGLMGEISALLVLVCERLGLDGLLFVPTHYHIALQTRRNFHFLAPEAERQYIALRRLLRELPLGEAIRALDEGRVVDRESGEPVSWTPRAMILPVSDRLSERVRRAPSSPDEPIELDYVLMNDR